MTDPPHIPIADQLRAALGPEIKARRVAHVAKRAGIHRPHLSGWLSGSRDLPIRGIDAVIRALDARVDVSVVFLTDRKADP